MEYKLYREKEEMSGNCLECGSTLLGRKDKKFCCISCKNAYNNRRQQQIRKYKSEILTSISRNYEILEMLLRDNTLSIELEEIERLGFDQSHITGHRIGKCGHSECICFDISYYKTERRIFNIHRNDITRRQPAPSRAPTCHR